MSGLGFESKRPIETVIKAYQPINTTNLGQIWENNINNGVNDGNKNVKLTRDQKLNLKKVFLQRISDDFDKYYTNYVETEPTPKSSATKSPPPVPAPKPVLYKSKSDSSTIAENIVKKATTSSSNENSLINKLKSQMSLVGGSLQSYNTVMQNIRQQLGIYE